MPGVSDGSVESPPGAVVNDYDSFGEAYVAATEHGLINGYYTRSGNG
jgi:hypothetical protein